MLRGGLRYATLSAANGQRRSHGRLFWECCAVVWGLRREDGPGRSALGVALREDLLRVRVWGTPYAPGPARFHRSERANRGGYRRALPLGDPRPRSRHRLCLRSTRRLVPGAEIEPAFPCIFIRYSTRSSFRGPRRGWALEASTSFSSTLYSRSCIGISENTPSTHSGE